VHANSVLLFERYALKYIDPGVSVLEIGPDDDPSSYRRLVSVPVTWATADLQSEVSAGERRWGGGRGDDLTFVMAREHEIPAPDEAFDVVVSGQVLEHVREPWRWMAEVARVCRRGGVVITVNPVSWPYHEAPIDCWRIYPDGMRALCEAAGLVVEESRYESLEPRPRRWYPGPSHDQDLGRRGRLANKLKKAVGWPLPIAFDTVTVARKPG
jgi:SAM-dependent methyltransferase